MQDTFVIDIFPTDVFKKWKQNGEVTQMAA